MPFIPHKTLEKNQKIAKFRLDFEHAVSDKNTEKAIDLLDAAIIDHLDFGDFSDPRNSQIFMSPLHVHETNFLKKLIKLFRIKSLNDMEKENTSLILGLIRQGREEAVSFLIKESGLASDYDVLKNSVFIKGTMISKNEEIIKTVCSLISDNDPRFLVAVPEASDVSLRILHGCLSAQNQKLFAEFAKDESNLSESGRAWWSKKNLKECITAPEKLAPPKRHM